MNGVEHERIAIIGDGDYCCALLIRLLRAPFCCGVLLFATGGRFQWAVRSDSDRATLPNSLTFFFLLLGEDSGRGSN